MQILLLFKGYEGIKVDGMGADAPMLEGRRLEETAGGVEKGPGAIEGESIVVDRRRGEEVRRVGGAKL